MSWKEISPLSNIRSRMDGLLEDIDSDEYTGPITATPPVDLIDLPGEIVVLVDLPGVSKDDVKLEGSSDMVEITAERSSQFDNDEHLIRERAPREYYRSIKLPTNIDDAAARASFFNGVLEVHLPKIGIADKKLITIE
ncbi:MAG: Hsp20/alpha crystallin family protein [Halobacteriota archaeon]|jgi:HSP20 family protein